MIGSESGIFWQVELLSKTSTKRTSRLLILLEYFFHYMIGFKVRCLSLDVVIMQRRLWPVDLLT